MKKFDSELAGNDFKFFCKEILLAIVNIEQILAKENITQGVSIRIGADGYLSLDVNDSKWRMVRCKKGSTARIIYEHSEEINVPESKGFDKISENLVEISLVFASLQPEIRNKKNIDSLTWKQEFVT